MKGTKAVKTHLYDKMSHEFLRLFKKQNIRCTTIKQLSHQFVRQERQLGSLHAIESLINDMLTQHTEDPNSDSAELGRLLEAFIEARKVFFERTKIHGIELFIKGSTSYLHLFNEGD